MNVKHTPGPWEIWEDEKGSVLRLFAPKKAPGFNNSCFIRGVEFKAMRNGAKRGTPVTYAGFTKEDEANAKLIAAAPLMIEALQQVEKRLTEMMYRFCDNPSDVDNDITVVAIRNAIKSATE